MSGEVHCEDFDSFTQVYPMGRTVKYHWLNLTKTYT